MKKFIIAACAMALVLFSVYYAITISASILI